MEGQKLSMEELNNLVSKLQSDLQAAEAVITSQPYKVGEHYVIAVPPGWMLVGTVAEVLPKHIRWKDAAWIEAVGSQVYALATAKTAKEQQAVATTSNPIRDGFLTLTDAITMAAPSVESFRALARSDEAKAIKGAR